MTTIELTPDVRRGWNQANCLGIEPRLFFAETEAGVAEAKAVCQGCSISKLCLGYALGVGEKKGVWGGTDEAERAELLTGLEFGIADLAEADVPHPSIRE